MQFSFIVAVVSWLVITLVADASRKASEVKQERFEKPNNATSEEDQFHDLEEYDSKLDVDASREASDVKQERFKKPINATSGEDQFPDLEEYDSELDVENFQKGTIKSATDDTSDANGTSANSSATEHYANDEGDAETEGDIFCESPPNAEGTFPLNLGPRHPVRAEVTYRCEFGYVSRGSAGFRSVCEYDELTRKANWTNPNVVCIPRSCGDPGFVENAQRIGSLFTFPNKVEYQCQEGYKSRGYAVRYCHASGEWSGKLPTCEKIYCNPPARPENGRVRYNSMEYGTELRYECNRGFILKNHQTRFCTEIGTWSNNDPICIEASCDIPEDPVNGYVQVTNNPKVDSIAFFSCNEGTALVGASASKCLVTGQWTFPPPKCSSLCTLFVVSDGRVGRYKMKSVYWRKHEKEFVEDPVGTTIKHGENVTVVCDEGFVAVESWKSVEGLSSSEEVICEDGRWSKELQCKSTSCLGEPPPIDNGYPVARKRTNGYTIYYKCNYGYVKDKSGKVTCFYGTWEGPTPTCVDGRCYVDQLNVPGLAKPREEFVVDPRYITVSCMKRYRKLAVSWAKISCVKGEWQVPEETCAEEDCFGQPPPTEHGRPKTFKREPNSEVEYECEEHYELAGLSTVQCRAGEWRGTPPNCVGATTTVHAATSFVEAGYAREKEEDSNVSPRPLTDEKHILTEAENCSCFFEHDHAGFEIHVNGKNVQNGNSAKKGDTVIFKCRDQMKRLTWQNGLRISGIANLTCECQTWKDSDLPYCDIWYIGDSFIDLKKKLKLVPGGDVEIRPRERLQIPCSSWNVDYPTWNVPQGVSLPITHESKTVRGSKTYRALLNISEFQPELAGEYLCVTKNPHNDYYYRPTKIHIRYAEPDVRCPVLDNKDIFNITYTNNRKVNSLAQYFCRKTMQSVAGTNVRTCLDTGKWSEADPVCIDITCPEFRVDCGLEVSYTIERKIGSIATFHCTLPNQLTGRSTTECLRNGTWAHPQPKCEKTEIRCPEIDDRGIFTILYKPGKRVNTTADFYCVNTKQKIVGPNKRTCLQTGKWSDDDPICIDITCPEFVVTPGLHVRYTDERRAGSYAYFNCEHHALLSDSSVSTCKYDGTWRSTQPVCLPILCPFIDERGIFNIVYSNYRKINSTARFSCISDIQSIKDSDVKTCMPTGEWSGADPVCVAPGCSIGDLAESLPEPVVPFLQGVEEDLLPIGAELKLVCDGVVTGSRKAVCNESGSWQYGKPQCVPACYLNIDEGVSLLKIESPKEYYRVGESAVLYCPPGYSLTADVERVMCLGNSWSDTIPDCREDAKTDEDITTQENIEK